MKKCRRCTKPATLHITEIKEGEGRTLHLCENCAQEYLSQVNAGDAADDDSAFAKGEFPEGAGAESGDEMACPECGITFKKFRSQGRLGCPHDYVAFRERLVPLLESIHGATQHVGKAPQRRPAAPRQQHELARLRSELKSAVEAEDYEQAARLRDTIKEKESEGKR
jgi:protein arginine kinase activator